MAGKSARACKHRCGAGLFRAIGAVVLAVIVGAPAAYAQAQSVVPPVRSWIDATGVDAMTGEFRLSTKEVVIGQPGAGGLAHGRDWIGTGWRDHLAGTVNSSGSIYTVTVGGRSETFSLSSGTYTSQQAMGSTLTADSNEFTYTVADGTVAIFSKALANAGGYTNFWSATDALITSLTKPDGEIITWTYATGSYGGGTGRRPQSVSNNLGYQIFFTYDGSDFLKRTRVIGINRAYYYCSNSATSCDVDGDSKAWPYIDYSVSGSIESVTDRLGNANKYVFASGKMTGVRKPSSPNADTVTIAYISSGGHAGKVASVTVPSEYEYWNYDYSDNSGVRTTTVQEYFQGGYKKILSNISSGTVTEVWADSNGNRKTLYRYDGNNRVDKITSPDGDYVEIDYDGRGNIESVTRSKNGTSLPSIVVSASYPGSCANAKTCNKPTTTTAANGAVTTYEYASTHGGVTKITLAEPSSGADQPETRFTYAERKAHYKNSGGSVVEAPTGVFRLTEMSACAVGEVSSSCVGTANETKTEITYGSSTTSVPNNRLPTIVTVKAGNNSISSTTTTAYRPQGDVETVEDPLANVTSFFYDDGRRLRASVTPDPGAGLDPRVTRITYNADSLPTTIDTGYASSAANWNSLTVLHTEVLTYDEVFTQAVSVSKRSVPGTIYARTDYSYTYNGSLECTTKRMNPAEFNSLQAGYACLDFAGGANADRILRVGYDEYNATDLIELNGRDERFRTFAAGGTLESERDANSNLTTYTQDDYRRLVRTDFPSKSTPNTSDTGDNAQIAYDDYGRIVGFRNREDKWTNYCYDALGRMTKEKFTNSSSQDTSCSSPDLTISYDNFGRVISATRGGYTLSYVYDALGRLTSETQNSRTVSYLYNAAGWRTRTTWPDSFYVEYIYNNVGEVTEIREMGQTSGAALLAVIAYDNLGRRTSLTRGGGGTTGYGYDGGSEGPWLTDLDHDLGGSSYDLNLDLTHNPAAQVATKSVNNPSYLHTLPSDHTHTYSVNGLNQYTAAGGVTPTYDGRENVANDGTKSYVYDHANRMVTAGTVSLLHDAVGRLFNLSGASIADRTFLFDGVDVIAEYDSGGSLVRRYVHGPGVDEPLVWFEGAGYHGSGSPNRNWLYADERGSIVAVEGSSTSVNTYDDYGVPGGSNTGRFQYTGQMWLSEIGLYHYKARAYNPNLGRFMQPDPIGYGDGMNLYSYVRNDPINGRDPLGLDGNFCITVPAWTELTRVVRNGVDTYIGIVHPREDICFWDLSGDDYEAYSYPGGTFNMPTTLRPASSFVLPKTSPSRRLTPKEMCAALTAAAEAERGRTGIDPSDPRNVGPAEVIQKLNGARGNTLAYNLYVHYQYFRNGGSLDYKSMVGRNATDDERRAADNYGNVIYGALGITNDIPGDVLDWFAAFLDDNFGPDEDDFKDDMFNQAGQAFSRLGCG